jgi:hypothetical protein
VARRADDSDRFDLVSPPRARGRKEPGARFGRALHCLHLARQALDTGTLLISHFRLALGRRTLNSRRRIQPRSCFGEGYSYGLSRPGGTNKLEEAMGTRQQAMVGKQQFQSFKSFFGHRKKLGVPRKAKTLL